MSRAIFSAILCPEIFCSEVFCVGNCFFYLILSIYLFVCLSLQNKKRLLYLRFDHRLTIVLRHIQTQWDLRSRWDARFTSMRCNFFKKKILLLKQKSFWEIQDIKYRLHLVLLLLFAKFKNIRQIHLSFFLSYTNMSE